ncbi:MAG: dienelactone hydrolase family protein [Candidatus Marinimicrobia bacterium]|nr:dienelactone hydrolase family protein [Candidatus Neomarinimicrobiota bacterium]
MTAAVNSKLVTRTYCPSDNPQKAVIGLHGWTGNEHVFEPVAKMMKVDHGKWYFPRAPYKADTGKGYTWFSGSDEKGWKIEKTLAGMHQLLAKIQSDGFSSDNIFLIGFSQGASLSMEIALRLPFAIGGIIPIAGFIKFMETLKNESTAESTKTPVLLLHGIRDEIIPVKASKKAYDFFNQRGHNVHLETYDAGHKIPLRTAPMIQNFITDSFNFFEVNSSEFTE